MVVIKVKRDTSGGEKYLKNAVNYVGDGRAVEVKGDGVDSYNTKNTYDQMMAVKKNLADKYQLITGIHEENQGGSFYHAHMIMNSVNYHNGKLYNSSPEEIAKLRDHVADVTGRICRFYFE